MQRTFTFDAAFRDARAGAIMCIGLALAGASCLFLFPAITGGLFYFWIALSVLFGAVALIYAAKTLNARLMIDGNIVTYQTPWTLRTVDLSTVGKAAWGCGITLHNSAGKIHLPLNLLSSPDHLVVLRYLREALPVQTQRKWASHGVRFGLQLGRPLETDVGEIGVGPKLLSMDPSHEWEVRERVAMGDASAAGIWQGAELEYRITDEEIIQLAGERTDIIRLMDVVRLEWRTFEVSERGSSTPSWRSRVTLWSNEARMDVYFVVIARSERLQFIRRLRYGIPRPLQQGWREFCRTNAFPLQNCECPYRPLAPHETRLTRRVIDRKFLWGHLIGLAVLIGIASALKLWPFLGNPRVELMFIYVGVVLIPWIFFRRLLAPAEGTIVYRTPLRISLLNSGILIWVIAGLLLLGIVGAERWVLAAGAFLVWITIMSLLIRAAARRKRLLKCQRNRLAVRQWDKVEKWLSQQSRYGTVAER